MFGSLTMRHQLRPGGAGSETVARTINFFAKPGPSRTVGHVERELPSGGVPAYLAARGSGVRSFVLWADEYRGARVATVVTAFCEKGVSVYQVLGAHGELLCTVRREKAFTKGLRTRWTVSGPGAPDVVGYKGRIIWWCVWWLFSPLVPLFYLASLLNGDGEPLRGPGRIIWREGGRVPLQYKAHGKMLYLHEPLLDPRAGAGLLALVRSFDGRLLAWDRGRN
ncbi:hypothetical protein [Streptomyces sp. JH34]|uniref:hypothetical protein n=1 Tax=Streptomyces sp. JH34 TaxID=2793633 RepID=UPI0023FA3AF7|nr:hypothetical protein [Streptomyces sp. JH34]MDF6018076.1 hypothetical protein [Streptomyces sp. JH34]